MDASPRQPALSPRAIPLNPTNSSATPPDVFYSTLAGYLFSMQYLWTGAAVVTAAPGIPIPASDNHSAVGQPLSISPSRHSWTQLQAHLDISTTDTI